MEWWSWGRGVVLRGGRWVVAVVVVVVVVDVVVVVGGGCGCGCGRVVGILKCSDG